MKTLLAKQRSRFGQQQQDTTVLMAGASDKYSTVGVKEPEAEARQTVLQKQARRNESSSAREHKTRDKTHTPTHTQPRWASIWDSRRWLYRVYSTLLIVRHVNMQ